MEESDHQTLAKDHILLLALLLALLLWLYCCLSLEYTLDPSAPVCYLLGATSVDHPRVASFTGRAFTYWGRVEGRATCADDVIAVVEPFKALLSVSDLT